jgi:hypothetical protein
LRTSAKAGTSAYINTVSPARLADRVAGAPEGGDVRIRHTSVYVDDQRAALRFYTEVLGFVK